jgi:hypothetical protein
MKSGNLNLLEPTGAVKAYIGIDVPSCVFDTVRGLRVSSRDICIIKCMVILQLISHILYGRSPTACKAVLHSRQNVLFQQDDRTPLSCHSARMVIDFCCIFLFVSRLPTCGTIWLSVNALGCAPTGAFTQERFAVIRTRQSRSACATAWWVLTVFDVPSYKGRPRRWSLWRRGACLARCAVACAAVGHERSTIDKSDSSDTKHRLTPSISNIV